MPQEVGECEGVTDWHSDTLTEGVVEPLVDNEPDTEDRGVIDGVFEVEELNDTDPETVPEPTWVEDTV